MSGNPPGGLISDVRPRVRVLSLDDGGVRGLSSLFILRELMERIAVKRGISDPSSARPCDYFDMIVGTGTGGISALFLGRLRMTIRQAIEEYISMAEAAFEPSSTWVEPSPNAVLNGRALTQSIRDVTKRFIGDYDAPFADPSAHCRTVVLAATSAQSPYIFRSHPYDKDPAFTIHEVARATASATGLYSPISLGEFPVQFVDSGLVGYNNPAHVAMQEVIQARPDLESGADYLVSLGAGLYEVFPEDENWATVTEVSQAIVQSCEREHKAFFNWALANNLIYFRFNIASRRFAHMTAKEWTQTDVDGELTMLTHYYTTSTRVRLALAQCIQALDQPSTAFTHDAFEQDSREMWKFLPIFNPAPEIFHGREEYVDLAVHMLLKEEAAYLTISGPGGIGKTSIAKVILQHPRIVGKFGVHRYFISCDDMISYASLIYALCVAFKLHKYSGNILESLPDFLIHAYTNKSLLLILDNFDTILDFEHGSSGVEKLLHCLGNVPRLSVILTMRMTRCPTGLPWTLPQLPVVQPLSLEAAHQTFMSISGEVYVDRDKLDELLLALDNVPLAITLIAHLGWNEQPAHLLERWNKEHTELLSPPQDQSRLGNLDISIQISLNSCQMQANPASLSLLSIVALLPAGVLYQNLPSISPKLANWVTAAGTLFDVGLVFYDSAQTVQVLSPVCSYMMKYHPPTVKLSHNLVSFYLQLATLGRLNPGDDGHQAAIVTLTHERVNIEAIITRFLTGPIGKEDDMEALIQAALDWTNFLNQNKPCKTIICLAIDCAQRSAKKIMLAQCLMSLGAIECMLSNYNAALEKITKAQTLFAALGNEQQAVQCLHKLGDIQYALDNYTGAEEMFLAAQAECDALGDRQGVAKCLQGLGKIHKMQNKYTSAQEVLSSAQLEFKTLGMQLDAAYCLKTLGNIQIELQGYENAQALLTEAQNEFLALGYQHGAMECLQSLADTWCKLENYTVALDMYLEAQVGFEACGDHSTAVQCSHEHLHLKETLKTIEDANLAAQARELLKGPKNMMVVPPIAKESNVLPKPPVQEPFSRHSILCLDGQITHQSKFVVASGGFADVWTGTLGSQTVAIKIMRPFSSGGTPIEKGKLLKQLWREYWAWSSLFHPNILECLGFSYDFSSHSPYELPSLISHWMANGTVLTYLASNPGVNRLQLLVGIANGLSYLHTRQPVIVHGDLRAGNILVSDAGVARLTDFGLSRILSETRGMSTSSDVAGSLRWMSPELFRRAKLSQHSDVWAYGMTVLEILSGKRPYHDFALDPVVIYEILDGRHPSRPVSPGLTDGIWAICQKCWHLQAIERPSIGEVLAELMLEPGIANSFP